jgi:hypothetical protein
MLTLGCGVWILLLVSIASLAGLGKIRSLLAIV